MFAQLLAGALAGPARILESSTIHRAEEAVAYDAMVRRHAWVLNRPFVKILSRLGLKRGRVLDIGTGPGWVPIELAQRHPGWEIWGVDASEDMLDLARLHAEQAGVADRVHFLAGDAADLPFEAGHFDLVVSHFTLHHLGRPVEMLDEAARVVRGGGQVIIKDLRRQPHWRAALLLAFSRYVLGYDELQLQMYRESMAAGLTTAEVRALLEQSKLASGHVRGFRWLDYMIWAEKECE